MAGASLVDLVLASREVGGLQDGDRPPARAAGVLGENRSGGAHGNRVGGGEEGGRSDGSRRQNE